MTMNGTTPSSTLAPSAGQNTVNGVNGVVAQPVVVPDVSAPPRTLPLPSPTIIIAILGAAVTYLYGAGLLILAQQLRYTYGFDFAAALNASLQVPKQTIAIEGLRIFLSRSTLYLFGAFSYLIITLMVGVVIAGSRPGAGTSAALYRSIISLMIAVSIAYVIPILNSPTWVVIITSFLVATGASLIMEGLSKTVSDSTQVAKVWSWLATVQATILAWTRANHLASRFFASSLVTSANKQTTRFYQWLTQGRRRWIVAFVAFGILFIFLWLFLLPLIKLLALHGWGTVSIGLVVGMLGIAIAKSKALTGLGGAAIGLVLVYLSAPFPVYYTSPCGLVQGDMLRDSILPSVTLRDKGAGLVSGTLLSYTDGHWNVIVKGQHGYSVFRDADVTPVPTNVTSFEPLSQECSGSVAQQAPPAVRRVPRQPSHTHPSPQR